MMGTNMHAEGYQTAGKVIYNNGTLLIQSPTDHKNMAALKVFLWVAVIRSWPNGEGNFKAGFQALHLEL